MRVSSVKQIPWNVCCANECPTKAYFGYKNYVSKLHVTRVSCNLTLKLRFPITWIGSVQNCFCYKTQHFGTMKWEKSASTCKQAFTRYRKTLKANEDFLCVVRNINPTPEQWHRFQLRRGVGRKKSLTNVFMTHQFLFKTESQLSSHVPTITCADTDVTAYGIIVYTQYSI